MALRMDYTPSIVADTSGMDEVTWQTYRRQGLGGSDIAAVYGQSPFCTARDLYYVKLGIRTDFASYGEGFTMDLTDPYTEELPHDSTHIICEYSVLTDMEEELNITELTKKLSGYKENFFFYMVVENGTEIEYTVIYPGCKPPFQQSSQSSQPVYYTSFDGN